MYPEEGGHMERKIVFIVIFSILIISNVFCIATIIRINSGLTRLEEGKEKMEGKIDPLTRPGLDIPKEMHRQKERNLVVAQEIKKRLSKLEQRMGMGREKGAEHMREIEGKLAERIRKIEERLNAVEWHTKAAIGELEQRMNFRITKEKQIEKRLNGLERHVGDQLRRCVEDIREMEKKFERFEEGMHEAFRKLRLSK